MRQSLTLFLLLCLAACAARHPGNFAKAPPADDRLMAADTAKRLEALYPPGQTRLKLAQPASDPYGEALVRALRGHGYALAEGPDQSAKSKDKAAAPVPGLDLSYVVDRPASDLYRVLVKVGPVALSRAYRVQDGWVQPAGAWARAGGER